MIATILLVGEEVTPELNGTKLNSNVGLKIDLNFFLLKTWGYILIISFANSGETAKRTHND